MQDWDSRIKILKTNIQNAREKFVISNLKLKEKSVSAPIESPENTDSIVVNEKKEDNPSGNKIYENKDPLSSIELLKKEDNVIDDKIKTEVKLGLTEEITNKIDVTLEKEAKSEISSEVPKVDVSEAMEVPKVDVSEAMEVPKVDVSEAMEVPKVDVSEAMEVPKVDVSEAMEVPKVDVSEAMEVPKVDVSEAMEVPKVDVSEVMEAQEASKEEPKIEISSDKKLDNLDEVGVKKTELELLEEKNENDLTEDEEDRMYELRRLRAQKAMNKEANQLVEDGLKKADEEIAH